MLLLPHESQLSPSEKGFLLVARDAAMKRSKPYVLIGKARKHTSERGLGRAQERVSGEASPDQEHDAPAPWYAWVGLGAMILGAAYLLRPRPSLEGVVLVDQARDLDPGPKVDRFSSESDLAAAFRHRMARSEERWYR